MPTATVNGIEINYRLEGDGEDTIVLVNGLADDLETWAFQMDDLLAAGYRVLRFDNRGVGQTTAPPAFRIGELSQELPTGEKQGGFGAALLLPQVWPKPLSFGSFPSLANCAIASLIPGCTGSPEKRCARPSCNQAGHGPMFARQACVSSWAKTCREAATGCLEFRMGIWIFTS